MVDGDNVELDTPTGFPVLEVEFVPFNASLAVLLLLLLLLIPLVCPPLCTVAMVLDVDIAIATELVYPVRVPLPPPRVKVLEEAVPLVGLTTNEEANKLLLL